MEGLDRAYIGGLIGLDRASIGRTLKRTSAPRRPAAVPWLGFVDDGPPLCVTGAAAPLSGSSSGSGSGLGSGSGSRTMKGM